jgi:hypothetical protein
MACDVRGSSGMSSRASSRTRRRTVRRASSRVGSKGRTTRVAHFQFAPNPRPGRFDCPPRPFVTWTSGLEMREHAFGARRSRYCQSAVLRRRGPQWCAGRLLPHNG